MKTLQKLLLPLAAVIFVSANVHATMFWARPYDPNLQGWITRDPIGEVGVINLYQFVGNNPVNRIDPLGLAWYDWLNPVSYSSGAAGLAGDNALYPQARAHGYSSYSDALEQLNERVNESRGTTVIDDPYLDQRLANQSLRTIGDVAGEAANLYLTAATSVTPTGVGAKCVNLTFKTSHVAQHLKDLGLPAQKVEAAIASEIQAATKGASQTGEFWGRVTVDGKVVEYRAFTLPDGTINVGTYY